jgi:hypothetical protein
MSRQARRVPDHRVEIGRRQRRSHLRRMTISAVSQERRSGPPEDIPTGRCQEAPYVHANRYGTIRKTKSVRKICRTNMASSSSVASPDVSDGPLLTRSNADLVCGGTQGCEAQFGWRYHTRGPGSVRTPASRPDAATAGRTRPGRSMLRDRPGPRQSDLRAGGRWCSAATPRCNWADR